MFTTTEKIILPLLAAGILFILIAIGVYVPVMLSTEKECMQLGYKSGKIDYMLNKYCISRVDQTDIVLPIEIARQKLRR